MIVRVTAYIRSLFLSFQVNGWYRDSSSFRGTKSMAKRSSIRKYSPNHYSFTFLCACVCYQPFVFQGFVARPTKNTDGTLNLLNWECAIPGKKNVSRASSTYHLPRTPCRIPFYRNSPSSCLELLIQRRIFHVSDTLGRWFL